MTYRPGRSEAISSDDFIVAVMGVTGAGKSTFIDIATRQNGKNVGHSLQSCTAEIHPVRYKHPEYERPVVFIDTPGFDDTYKSDTEILTMIADWLNKTYKDGIKLAGIIYVHRITDNRMAGTPLKNLQMFANLCGSTAAAHVALVSTMWDQVPYNTGCLRETELLQQYWKPMVDLGSHVDRFDGTFERAWTIMEWFRSQTLRDALLIQEEMVDLHKRLCETQAGMALYDALRKLLAEQRETIRQLREQATQKDNIAITKDLNAEYEKIEKELDRTFALVRNMKVPIGRRILSVFSFKKTRGHAMTIPTP